MNTHLYEISYYELGIAVSLVFPVIFFYYRWGMTFRTLLYSVFRMFLQLMLIGYILVYVFNSRQMYPVLAVLLVMIIAAAWISLSVISEHRQTLFQYAVFSIFAGGSFTLFIIIILILELSPWYEGRYIIPLAGMIYANAMNSVSLAAERFYSELKQNQNIETARKTAFNASMIPVINSLFAVGLVSLPGMMTGQILSGVSPLTASRYQIVVMCMVLSSAGISTGIFLLISEKYFVKIKYSNSDDLF